MNHEKIHGKLRKTYSQIVGSYLKNRFGAQIGNRINDGVLSAEITGSLDEREAFAQMLTLTKEFKLAGYPVLELVLDRAEQESFSEQLLKDYERSTTPSGHALSFEKIFNKFIAPDLEDILGSELVTRTRDVYLRAIARHPGIPDRERFYEGMRTVYELIPDIWSADEFQEKVESLQETHFEEPAEDKTAETEQENGDSDISEAVMEIIIADLADILGEGETLHIIINSAKEGLTGIYRNEEERFTSFIYNILHDDFISIMFDQHWIEDKEGEWLNAFFVRKAVA